MSTIDQIEDEVLAPKRVIPREQLKLLSHEAMLEESGPSRMASSVIVLIMGLLVSATIWVKFC